LNILISAALNRELDPIRRTLNSVFDNATNSLSIIKIPKGMNTATSDFSNLLKKKRPDLCINTGTAGALSDDLRLFDLFFPTELVNKEGEIIPCGENPDTVSLKFPHWKSGRLYTSDKAVESSAEKVFLLTEYRAQAVDMEAIKVARLCRAAGVPCLALKVISDTADEQTKITFKRNLDRAIEILCEQMVNLIKGLLTKGDLVNIG